MSILKLLSNLSSGARAEGTPQKPSVLRDILDSPDDYKLEAYIEDDGLVIRVRKRQKRLAKPAAKTALLMEERR